MSSINDRSFDDEDEEDDDDDYIDDSSLGDWRSFRNSLSEGSDSLSSLKSLGSLDKNINVNEETEKRPKSVSKANEELLLEQNKELAKEYLDAVWAHQAPDIEVGGLVVRLPIEAEIYRNRGGETNLAKKMQLVMSMEDSSTLTDGDNFSKKKSSPLSMSILAAKTVWWYKKAQKIVEEGINDIAESANGRGEVDPSQLDASSKELLMLYLDNQEAWQEVCLVADRDTKKGTSTSYVLNRPMAFKLTRNLANLVYYGATKATASTFLSAGETGELSDDDILAFMTAFGNECAIYVGGPDCMDEPATIIHGHTDLEGAVEISPGSNIYKGGTSAAIEGVLMGKYNPLDFRFFVGRHEYKDGALDAAVQKHKYLPIACNRSLVLKQCIQLPKPLWHEILELCGGEMKEISSLEMMKRNDIQ
eukprot:CAMPEP_0184865930 /NCGR_PEP_ID=MMETSP0580-20130426/19794_1 /TAXON_ID=1118495 /ORGANISM="Dactyliosolen fragilissimus" /LENGTH=418 /DNA_ID=CAMNT_0027365329 /DNA_START=252 /DNA_END=1508 /DNA_ORIENTATION=+